MCLPGHRALKKQTNGAPLQLIADASKHLLLLKTLYRSNGFRDLNGITRVLPRILTVFLVQRIP